MFWGMSFKELKIFNQAFLAKQGWRILHNENSLLHKIYSAQYFSYDDFFEAKLGVNPSIAQRGIWEARKVLVRGRRWRIGDSLSAKVWFEPWVPVIKNFSCYSMVNVEEMLDDRVSSLLDSQANRWNVQKINSIFNARVVVAIFKIQLGSNRCQNKQIWSREVHGNFTIKSAYKILLNDKLLSRGENSSAPTCSPLWKKLRKLKIPQNISVFG